MDLFYSPAISLSPLATTLPTPCPLLLVHEALFNKGTPSFHKVVDDMRSGFMMFSLTFSSFFLSNLISADAKTTGCSW